MGPFERSHGDSIVQPELRFITFRTVDSFLYSFLLLQPIFLHSFPLKHLITPLACLGKKKKNYRGPAEHKTHSQAASAQPSPNCTCVYPYRTAGAQPRKTLLLHSPTVHREASSFLVELSCLFSLANSSSSFKTYIKCHLLSEAFPHITQELSHFPLLSSHHTFLTPVLSPTALNCNYLFACLCLITGM